MRQRRNFPLFAMMIASCLHCSDRGSSLHHSQLKTFFGENDLSLLSINDVKADPLAGYMGSIGVALLAGIDGDEDSFVLPYCSGIHLVQDYVLSAAHCHRESMVFTKHYIARIEDRYNYEFISFGDNLRILYQGEVIEDYYQPTAQIPLKLLYRSPDHDFALWQLAADQHESPGLGKAHYQEAGLYAYPNGLPLSLTRNCVVHEAPDGIYFQHNCDSLQGSSGGLISLHGNAFGMHIQGAGSNSFKAFQKSGKFEDESEFPYWNKGIKISFIAVHLREFQADLWHDIQQKCLKSMKAGHGHICEALFGN